MDEKSRILTLESGFPPELASGRLPYEFSKELVRRGNSVEVITSYPRKYLIQDENEKPNDKLFTMQNIDGICVIRIRPQFNSNSLFSRILEYFILPFTLFIGGFIYSKNKHVIHCTIPPLFIGFYACLLGTIFRIPVVTRVQDIHPDAIIKLGLIKNRFIIKLMEFLEKFIYLDSNHITVIGETYKQNLLKKGVANTKLSLVPNWADTNGFNINYHSHLNINLNNKFIITYAGTMSWPQDLETVIESANLLQKNNDILFLFVGDGVLKKRLIERSKKMGLNNIVFLPLQPKEEYFAILKKSSICLVSLKKNYSSPAVPSKMLDIMNVSKPILANVPVNSDVKSIIELSNSGLFVESENPDELKKAILYLYKNPELRRKMGENGKNYLIKNYSLKSAIDKYEYIFNFLKKNN